MTKEARFKWLRILRPKWLCARAGHVPYSKEYEQYQTSMYGFRLCSCDQWYPEDDPYSYGVNHPIQHARFSFTSPVTSGQPPVTYDWLQQQATPFVWLRNNPDEVAKMNFEDIRRLIVDRLADYEEGMDAE